MNKIFLSSITAIASFLVAACVEQQAENKSVLLKRGTIQGIVRDAETGARLPRMQVSAFFDQRWNTTLSLADDPQTRFSEAGSYAIANVPVDAAIPVSFAGRVIVDGADGPEEHVYSEWSTTATIQGLVTGETAQTQPVPSQDPIASVNANLVRKNAILRGRIYTADAQGELRDRIVVFIADFLAQGFQDVRRVWTVGTDGEGRFAIGTDEEKLPRAVLSAGNLYLLPLDVDGNGVPEYGTWVSSSAVNLSQFGRSEEIVVNLRGSAACNPLNLTPAPEILCSDPGRPNPTVVWSNVETGALFRAIPHSTTQNPIVLVFNIPMDSSLETNIDAAASTDPPSPLVTLRGNAGQGDLVAVSLKLENSVKLSITTPLDLVPGQRYVLSLSANARSTLGTVVGGSGFTLNLRAVKGNQPDLPEVKGIALDSDVGSPTREKKDVDWNSSTVQIRWDSLAEASGYSIYAKDTRRGADWANITPAANNIRSRGSLVVAVLSLAGFDVAAGDDADLDGQVAEATDDAAPFSEGNEIAIAVVGKNRDGLEAAPNPDTAFKLRDLKPPTCSLCALTGSPAACSADLDSVSGNQPVTNAAGQNDSGQNTSTLAKKILLRLRCSEFMDTTISPKLTLTDEGQTGCSDVGTASANSSTPAAGAFTWVNGREGYFELTVDASANESGDCFVLSWDGVKDTSGNPEDSGASQDQLTGDLR